MAVLNDIRALFVQCPALKDLEARTDKLETDAEGYSILPTGSAIIAQDMTRRSDMAIQFCDRGHPDERLTI